MERNISAQCSELTLRQNRASLLFEFFLVVFPGRERVFPFCIKSRQALDPTQPPIQWVAEAVFPRVKRQVREADFSPLSNAELKNGRAISPPLHASSFCGIQLIKSRDNFTFNFIVFLKFVSTVM
jgi:hypothetical protein